MKIEGSPQEIQVFINTFQDKNIVFNKQQLKQIEEIIKNAPELTEAQLKQINQYFGKNY